MSTRNDKGLFEIVWAGDATDNSQLPTFELGYDASYSVDKSPDRRNMNDVLAKATAVGVDVNKFGAGLPWASVLTYTIHALVMGSNGTLYVAQQANAGNDPTTSGITFWKTLGTVLWESEQEARVDIKIDDAKSATGSLGLFTNGVEHTNTSDRKIMVIAYGASANDIWASGDIGATSASIRTAHQVIFSDGFASSAATITFIVPPNWKWKADIGGNTLTSSRIEAWEI